MLNKKVLAVLTVAAVVVLVVVAVILSASLEPSSKPVFNIVDKNFDVDFDMDEEFNLIYTYTVYVKVKNEGADGSKTVWCEVIREDLSTIKKSQSVFLSSDQEKTVKFVFSHSELHGAVPDNYKVWVE